MEKHFNKLVRDKIPAIILSEGKIPTIKKLSDKEFLSALYEKLLEEISEFKESPSPEELSDIFEVLEEVEKYFFISQSDVEKIKMQKKETRGGFSEQTFLIKVNDK